MRAGSLYLVSSLSLLRMIHTRLDELPPLAPGRHGRRHRAPPPTVDREWAPIATAQAWTPYPLQAWAACIGPQARSIAHAVDRSLPSPVCRALLALPSLPPPRSLFHLTSRFTEELLPLLSFLSHACFVLAQLDSNPTPLPMKPASSSLFSLGGL